MTWKTRLMLRESAYTAAIFTIAIFVYYLVAFWGWQELMVEGPIKRYMLSSAAAFVEMPLTGILFGGLIGIVNRLTETPGLRRRPFGQIVAIRTALYLLGFALVFAFICLLVGLTLIPWQELAVIFEAISLRYLLSFGLYMTLVVVLINFSLEVERVVGPGNLWRLFTGRYRRPREEERIFLFIDLKGSTTLAESLGHKKYSELLQECFRDLTNVVMQHEAAIYQYVGDEVVMSWSSTDTANVRKASVQT